MNRIDIVVDGEKRPSFSAALNLESFEELQISLATILEEAVSMLRAPKVKGFPEQHLGEDRETCWRCGGVGRHESTNPYIMGGPHHEHCNVCHGSGII